ncbi:hypothetical protein BC828DRAFT_396796 [Blastocladiella britannica]|nr:hypothetical protein BC828DRAFT_396796 [Blastocladiella britannica]
MSSSSPPSTGPTSPVMTSSSMGGYRTTPLQSADTAAIQALASRIAALDGALAGTDVPSAHQRAPADQTLLTRLARLQLKLDATAATSPDLTYALRSLVPALRFAVAHATDPMAVVALAGDVHGLADWAQVEKLRHVPADAKAAIVEAAEPDVKKVFSELVRLEALEDELRPDAFSALPDVAANHTIADDYGQSLQAQVRDVEARVVAIMQGYGAYVDAISDIFVRMDESLREVERHVARVEGSRRRENE